MSNYPLLLMDMLADKQALSSPVHVLWMGVSHQDFF
jgi:hypothetical protein